jgi:hypothetical protein
MLNCDDVGAIGVDCNNHTNPGRLTYLIGLVNFVSMRYSKAIVLIEHYSSNINVLFSIFACLLWERLRQWYRQMIEC